MKVHIKKAETKKEIREFIDFPHRLYAHDKNYVPELYVAQKKLFDKRKNPFFKHGDAEFYLAEKNGKTEGRIALIKNGNYNQQAGQQHGFFGFFDVTEDFTVAEALLQFADEWAKKNRFTAVIGPVNFSTNDTCGVLIKGHDSPPVIMMTYQQPHHQAFLERLGYGKKMDLLAYRILPEDTREKVLQVHAQLEERIKRQGITIRKLNLKNIPEEAESIRQVYNAAWEKNWGFVPMTKEEFYFAAEDLKSIVDVDFVYLAEYNGKAIGFSLTIPNLNEVFIRIKRGRLFPSGIFKFLFFKNKVKTVRVLTLGVIEEFRKTGIDACFYARSIETARKKGIRWAEASWILEDNLMMNRALQNIGGEVYKKYRIYEKEILN